MSLIILVAIMAANSAGAREASADFRRDSHDPPMASEAPSEPSVLQRVARDVEGLAVTGNRELFGPKGADLVVVVFVTTTCPIANASMPSIRRLHELASKSEVDMVLVHPDPLVTPEAAREHADRRKLAMDILLDPGQVLARQLGARVVPEAFLLHRVEGDWEIRYRGPVDDLYAGVGRRRRAATTFHVHDAIQRIRAGLPIERPIRTAHGCAIERMVGS